jgi:hypothetical protein
MLFSPLSVILPDDLHPNGHMAGILPAFSNYFSVQIGLSENDCTRLPRSFLRGSEHNNN